MDLKAPDGVALIDRLAEKSDVAVENFRPGSMERLGLLYELLSGANPRLVYCSITGFSRTGPDAQRPAYDLII